MPTLPVFAVVKKSDDKQINNPGNLDPIGSLACVFL